MRIDFHVHTIPSSKAVFELERLQQYLHQAQLHKVDALVLTDHLRLKDWPTILETLDATYPYEKPCYLAQDIKLVPGMEITIAEGPHILLAGSRGNIRLVYSRLEPQPTFKQLLAAISDLNVITAVAHPLRHGAELTRLPKNQRDHLDSLELNANSVRRLGNRMSKQVYKLASRLRVTVIAGSDSHRADRIGAIATVLPRPFDSITDLRTMLREKQHTIALT